MSGSERGPISSLIHGRRVGSERKALSVTCGEGELRGEERKGWVSEWMGDATVDGLRKEVWFLSAKLGVVGRGGGVAVLNGRGVARGGRGRRAVGRATDC